MSFPGDTTDQSIVWTPGDTQGRQAGGNLVDVPKPRVSTADTPQTLDGETEEEADEKLEEEKLEDKVPSDPEETGMQPAGEPPSPPGELEANTNVETKALREAIREAPEDAPNGPQTDNVDISGPPPATPPRRI